MIFFNCRANETIDQMFRFSRLWPRDSTDIFGQSLLYRLLRARHPLHPGVHHGRRPETPGAHLQVPLLLLRPLRPPHVPLRHPLHPPAHHDGRLLPLLPRRPRLVVQRHRGQVELLGRALLRLHLSDHDRTWGLYSGRCRETDMEGSV